MSLPLDAASTSVVEGSPGHARRQRRRRERDETLQRVDETGTAQLLRDHQRAAERLDARRGLVSLDGRASGPEVDCFPMWCRRAVAEDRLHPHALIDHVARRHSLCSVKTKTLQLHCDFDLPFFFKMFCSRHAYWDAIAVVILTMHAT